MRKPRLTVVHEVQPVIADGEFIHRYQVDLANGATVMATARTKDALSEQQHRHLLVELTDALKGHYGEKEFELLLTDPRPACV